MPWLGDCHKRTWIGPRPDAATKSPDQPTTKETTKTLSRVSNLPLRAGGGDSGPSYFDAVHQMLEETNSTGAYWNFDNVAGLYTSTTEDTLATLNGDTVRRVSNLLSANPELELLNGSGVDNAPDKRTRALRFSGTEFLDTGMTVKDNQTRMAHVSYVTPYFSTRFHHLLGAQDAASAKTHSLWLYEDNATLLWNAGQSNRLAGGGWAVQEDLDVFSSSLTIASVASASGKRTLYVNGVEIDDTGFFGVADPVSTLWVGGLNDNGSLQSGFKGAMYAAAVIERALTPQEVLTVHTTWAAND